jgi:hypothetical protein
MARRRLGTLELMIESQEVCITLLFVEILSGEPS